MAKKHYVDKEEMREEIRACKARFESHMDTLTDPDRLTTDKAAVKYCSPALSKMLTNIVTGLSSKHNFRYYTFRKDMVNDVIMNVLCKWHKFDCDHTNKDGIPYSPLAYFTQISYHGFVTFINKEGKQKKVKEAIMEYRGEMGSWSTQVDNDEKNRLKRLQSDEGTAVVHEEENTDHT